MSRLSLVLAFVCSFFTISSCAQEVVSDYRLSAGDEVEITVYGEEDLSVQLGLSDAGTISYPLLGELNIYSMSTGEVSELIRRQLADGYLVNPNVSVRVLTYREFFINGQVEKPGAYPYQPGLSLQKAVALAGGFTERASENDIFITKDGSNSKQKAKTNAIIQPGDVITVEESFF